MLKVHFRPIIFWVSLVYVLSDTLKSDETSYVTPNHQLPCLHTTTQSTGSLYVSEFTKRNHTCVWKINVTNADSIRVAIGYNVTSTVPFTKHNLAFRVIFYNAPPKEDSVPLTVWRIGDDRHVHTFPGNQLWIISAHQDQDLLGVTPDPLIMLSYLANDDGTDKTCDKSDIILLDDLQKKVGHGQHIFGHRRHIVGHRWHVVGHNTFGSFAELVCDEGFVLGNGNGRLQCLAENGGLAWASDGSTCDTVCKHPRSTPNANISLEIGVQQGLDSEPMADMDQNILPTDETDAQIRSIAEYTCEEPFYPKGEDRIHCGPDDHGIPTWSGPPPLCVIPDCSEPHKLTRSTGTIVTPSHPGGRFQGGSVLCTWEILAPTDGHVSLTVRYVDLPVDGGVALSVFDAARPRPVQLLRLTGYSDVVSVTSVTSRVLVMYQGPSKDVINHKGFYVDYVMKSKQLRTKRNDDLSDVRQADADDLSDVRQADADDLSDVRQADADDLTFQVDDNSDNWISAAYVTVDEEYDAPVATNDISPDTSTLGNVIASSTLSTLLTTDGLPFDVATQNLASTVPASPTQLVDTSYAQTVSTPGREADTPPSPSPQSVVDSEKTDTPVDLTTDEIDNGQITPEVTRGEIDNGEITPEVTTDKTDHGVTTPEKVTDFIGRGEITHYPVTPLAKNLTAPVSDDPNDDWKIAVGVVIPLLILTVTLAVGYYCYRRRYPVRMIIGRDFGKFTNPTYSRNKQVISLVRDDADDYFAHRSTSTLTLDEMNPVNRNISYDNPAFVADERDGRDNDEEEERRFREKKAWLFKKDAEISETHPVKDSEGKTRSHASEIEIPGAGSEGFKNAEEMQMTPRALPRKKKLARARSVSILTDTSIELQVSKSETSSASSEEVEEPLKEDAYPKSSSAPKLEDTEGTESNYMKVAKMIFEQPSYEEVCAEYKARSRSMSLDRAPPESRMRSYSVDPFKSARRHSLRGEVIQLEHWKNIANDTNLPKGTIIAVLDSEKLGQSGKSISSIISETPIIDVSVLDGLPFEARERCLSFDSLNSNPHLVTDLDDVSTGSSVLDAEENGKDVTAANVFLSSASSDSSDGNNFEKPFPQGAGIGSTEDERLSDPIATNEPLSEDIFVTDDDIISPLPKSEEFKSDIFFFPNACISIDENTDPANVVESTTDPRSSLNLSGTPEEDDLDTSENKSTILKFGGTSDFEKYEELEDNRPVKDIESSSSSSSSSSSRSSGSESSKTSRSNSSSDVEDELHSYSFTQEIHETQMSQNVGDFGVERLSLNSETGSLPPPLPVTPLPMQQSPVLGLVTARPITFSADDDSNYFQFPPRDAMTGSSQMSGDLLTDNSSYTADLELNPRNENIGSSILHQIEDASMGNIVHLHDFERGEESDNEAREKIPVEDIFQIVDSSVDEDNASRQLRIRSSFSGPVSSDLGHAGTFVLTAEDDASDDIDV